MDGVDVKSFPIVVLGWTIPYNNIAMYSSDDTQKMELPTQKPE